jgi:hypothetical protein
MERHKQSKNALFLFWQHIGLHALYDHQHPMATFPVIPGFREERIVTSGRTIADVTDEIMRKSGL